MSREGEGAKASGGGALRRIAIVAWRDFRLTVLRKTFLLAIVGIPVLMIGIMVVAGVLMVRHEEPPLVGTVAVIDAEGDVADAVRAEFESERVDADRAPTMPGPGMMPPGSAGPMPMGMALARGAVEIDVRRVAGDRAALDAQHEAIRSGELVAAAWFPASSLDPDAAPGDDEAARRFDLVVAEGLDSDHVSLIERRLAAAAVRVRASRSGLDVERTIAMLRRPASRTTRLGAAGEAVRDDAMMREMRQLVPMAFMLLLWIATFTAGQHLLTTTIEEKSNRVMEVLLSAVSPMQLMTGKIIGQGGVGLLIVLIYGSVGIAGLVSFALMHLVDPIDLAWLAIYFFMAYFMIASIMAAVGSAVSDLREANTLMTPVMLVLMLPLFLWMPIISAPNGPVAVTCSFIPPAIPFAMILRVGADEAVPFWQIPATIVWGYACVLGMVWMAAKIFRVGVLMYGKPPSPLQLLKWIRYA